MGGESSMSTVESGLEVPTGSENELLRIRGAQLCLIDGEESVIIQSGDFAFHVIKQTESPLAATVGLVGDFQWPVGKDSPALKVGNKKYAFALPGLVYGLVLPANTPVEAVQSLEGLLQQYSTFEQYPEISDDSNESVCSASGSARPPASTRPHRSNSPFQQYSRPMDQAASTLSPFHFALGIDKQSSRQHQNM